MGINNTIGGKIWQPTQPEKQDNPSIVADVVQTKAAVVYDDLEEIEDLGTQSMPEMVPMKEPEPPKDQKKLKVIKLVKQVDQPKQEAAVEPVPKVVTESTVVIEQPKKQITKQSIQKDDWNVPDVVD